MDLSEGLLEGELGPGKVFLDGCCHPYVTCELQLYVHDELRLEPLQVGKIWGLDGVVESELIYLGPLWASCYVK